jgi:hypothetical protein
MKDSKSRDRAETTHESKELIDTIKALIELYKSAFGDQWQSVFGATVKVYLTGLYGDSR